MFDNHIHTKLCKHAVGEVFDYVERAIQLGLTEIAFTDHIPLPDKFDIHHRMTLAELDIYRSWVFLAKEKYPEITIRFGIEADYYEGFERYVEKILNEFDFDMVIMSIHYLRHWPDGNWVFDYSFEKKSQMEVYKDYLMTVTQGVQTGLFDILGHVDMIKLPGDSLVKLIPLEVGHLLQMVKNAGMSIEINTSGYRKKTGEPYPGLDWINPIKNAGIPLTIGSDAHAPEQVGLKFGEVLKRFKAEGIQSLSHYEKRNQNITMLESKKI